MKKSLNFERRKPIYRADEVAQMLGITRDAVYKMVTRGQLPARKLGKRLIFLEDELISFVKSLPSTMD